MTEDKNHNIMNEIEDLTFEDLNEEIKKVLTSRNLKIPYKLESELREIKKEFINNEINKNNIHNIQNHNFKIGELENIDKLQEIKKIIKNHFENLNKDDKIKEIINSITLKSKQISENEFKEYGISESENYYWGRVYTFNKKKNVVSFSLSEYNPSGYDNSFTNYYNHNSIRNINFLVKEFLGIMDFDLNKYAKTSMKNEDFKEIDLKNGLKIKVYKNGRFDIKHKKAIDIFNEFKKYGRDNEVFL